MVTQLISLLSFLCLSEINQRLQEHLQLTTDENKKHPEISFQNWDFSENYFRIARVLQNPSRKQIVNHPRNRTWRFLLNPC